MPVYHNNHQPCPNCEYFADLTYRFEVLGNLYKPYDASSGLPGGPASRQEFAVCRRCGFVYGHDDPSDILQQEALDYKADIELALAEQRHEEEVLRLKEYAEAGAAYAAEQLAVETEKAAAEAKAAEAATKKPTPAAKHKSTE